MDIYLTEINDKNASFAFPSLPSSIKVKSGAKYQSYDIIGKGTIKIPKGTETASISWSSEFFGWAKRREPIVREWIKPAECIRMLNYWMDSGTVLRLMVTGTSINYDVTISSFETEPYGAHGNVKYSITLTQYKSLKVYTTVELNIAAYVGHVESRPDEEGPKNENTYTVVSGDNLWKIAKRFYGGNGSDWKKIYDANQAVIEEAAKKHGKRTSDNGHWIYPGTVFTIP